MKPENKLDLLDFDSLSTNEMEAMIEVLTAKHKERVAQDKRRRKAEEYECRIYDLISEAQHDGFTIRIEGTYIPTTCTVEVYD